MKRLLTLIFLLLSTLLFSQNKTEIENLEEKIASLSGKEKYEALCDLSRLYYRSQPQKTYNLALEVLNYANKNDEPGLKEKAYVRMGIGVYLAGKTDSAIYYSRKALGFNPETRDAEEKEFAMNLLSLAYDQKGVFDKSIEYGEKVLELRRERHDTTGVAAVLGNLATIYMNTGQYEKCAACIDESISIYEAQKDTIGVAGRLLTMVQLMNRSGSDENEKATIQRALGLINKVDYPFMKADILSTMATYFISAREFDSAFFYERMALDYYEKVRHQHSIALSYGNLARIEEGRGNNVNARHFFRKEMEIFEKLNLEPQLNIVRINLGLNYLQNNLPDSAEVLLFAGYHSAKKIKQAQIIQHASKYLSILFKQKQLFEEALHYHEIYAHYQDSLAGVSSKSALAELETKYETAQKQRAIEKLENEKKIQESRERTIMAISGSSTLILLLLVAGIWQKRRKDKVISRQKELVYQKEKALNQAQLEKQKLKEEELEQSLLYKSKQLNTHALHMMQKNTMLQDIQSDIKELSKAAAIDDKPRYKQIQRQIAQSLRADNDWDVFRLYFEEVNDHFFEKLDAINEELTTHDHRLCALIKLNMNSKEMASVLNLAPNSIKSARYRLKKKLNLAQDADLESFIREL